jgi:sulfatase maturation enzyme AslB (radical SAM superfamily)
MKITIKKIIKAFMPYGILWIHNRINHELKIKNSKFKPRKALRFQIHITDHCNLNCKYCGHYSPVANKKFLDPAVFEKYLQRIQELTGGGGIQNAYKY